MTITPITRHHAVVIKRQLALLPNRGHYVVSCDNCEYRANTLRLIDAEDLRKAHVRNPYC